eukprot:252270_1
MDTHVTLEKKCEAYGLVQSSESFMDEEHPRELCCPITLDLMKDPVILMSDGHTYERAALMYWLQSNHTSPVTNQPLKSKQCITNFAIKSQIESYNRKIASLSNRKYQKSFSSSRGKLRPSPSSITVNVQLFGDCNVGKTTLRKFVEFSEHRTVSTTMGPEFSFVEKEHLYRNKTINARLGDIAGQFDRFHNLMKQCFRNIHGAVLVCSVDERKSVKHLLTKWHQKLLDHAPQDVYVIVIINKCDLLHTNAGHDIQKTRQYERVQKAAIQFANRNGYPVYNTSCITGQYIHAAFNDLLDRIIRDEQLWRRLIEDKPESIYLKNKIKVLPEKNSGNCC